MLIYSHISLFVHPENASVLLLENRAWQFTARVSAAARAIAKACLAHCFNIGSPCYTGTELIRVVLKAFRREPRSIIERWRVRHEAAKRVDDGRGTCSMRIKRSKPARNDLYSTEIHRATGAAQPQRAQDGPEAFWRKLPTAERQRFHRQCLQ